MSTENGADQASQPGAAAASSNASTQPKVEVSAATIARMMGVATQSDLKLLDGKLDLLTTKLNSMIAKVDRIQTSLSSAPSASDIDRLDINVGSVKMVVREVLDAVNQLAGIDPNRLAEASESAEQSKKLRAGIKSNAPSTSNTGAE